MPRCSRLRIACCRSPKFIRSSVNASSTSSGSSGGISCVPSHSLYRNATIDAFSRLSAVMRFAADAVLVQPLVQVQLLEDELDAAGNHCGLLARIELCDGAVEAFDRVHQLHGSAGRHRVADFGVEAGLEARHDVFEIDDVEVVVENCDDGALD